MYRNQNPEGKPAILIYIPEGFLQKNTLEFVTHGIEEEGIFYFVEEIKGKTDAKALSAEASLASRLDVGLGFDLNGDIALNYQRMTYPLYHIKSTSTADEFRNIGVNAARLVKGVPLI